MPLVGFHMPKDEIELDGVRIVRADTVDDAPVDAVEASRTGKRQARIPRLRQLPVAAVAPAAAVADDLRRALRTMRLFRPGAVGLAAHGWARRSGGWERFGTGSGRARQGGYRLTGNEAAELESFSRPLAERGARLPALDWAASRFELGAERASLIEALSDYLLALRGLLEGGGPDRTSLAARVAVLACEPDEREQGRLCVERALALERKLMSGGRYKPRAGASPLDVIAEARGAAAAPPEGARHRRAGGRPARRRRRGAAGRRALGGAREKPGIGETAEWRLPDPVADDELDLSDIADGNLGEIEVHRVDQDEVGDEAARTRIASRRPGSSSTTSNYRRSWPPTGPAAADRARARGGRLVQRRRRRGRGRVARLRQPAPRPQGDEREGKRGESSERVRYLFPVPDSTDWDVGELRYERKKSS